MAIYKCKMCGGTIEFEKGDTVGVCDSCGTKQTLPKTNDDIISNLFNRANNLRLKCEFDKAAQIYEKILEQDDSEAEAHWGIVLCKYGIEYVEDPKTFKRIPTCHRTLFEAVTADADYLAAIDYSDTAQQHIYESEARAIDRIQKDILAIVKNEKPFDVFICYKETDENGKRTIDSTIANDIYYQLTQEGFKVFFAAITLEDKLGQEYEPYIFAALNSAKVMLVLGTKPEYYSAVWVKNEWSRFLQLMKSDRSKSLIPCYRDMDAYDLPEEFAHLQAQDMSKIGFINDVVRGIKKLTQTDEPKASAVSSSSNSSTIAPLLKRAFLFLEDKNWSEADDYFEKVLDLDPENAEAYLGKLMVELNVTKKEELKDCAQPFDSSNNYTKVMRFADSRLKADLEESNTYIRERNENQRLTNIYNTAVMSMESANSEDSYKTVADIFKTIPGFKDADTLRDECLEKAEILRKDGIYSSAIALLNNNTINACNEAIMLLNQIADWRDSDKQIYICKNKISEIEAYNKEQERIAKEKARKTKKTVIKVSVIAIVAVAIASVLLTVVIPNNKYEKGKAFYENKQYKQAYDMLEGINVKDSAELALESITYYAKERIEANDVENACPAYNIIYGDNNSKKPDACLYYNQKSNLDDVSVGSTIKFGYYEQDNDSSNGKEEIEWIVLEKTGNRAFVVSKYVLDGQPWIKYKEGMKVSDEDSFTSSWDTSDVKKWIHSVFYNNAFTTYHQMYLNDLSLLTLEEYRNYSKILGDYREGEFTSYALDINMKYYNSKNDSKYRDWLIRKTTTDPYTCILGPDGYHELYQWNGCFGVRPVMHIEVNS